MLFKDRVWEVLGTWKKKRRRKYNSSSLVSSINILFMGGLKFSVSLLFVKRGQRCHTVWSLFLTGRIATWRKKKAWILNFYFYVNCKYLIKVTLGSLPASSGSLINVIAGNQLQGTGAIWSTPPPPSSPSPHTLLHVVRADPFLTVDIWCFLFDKYRPTAGQSAVDSDDQPIWQTPHCATF